MSEIVQIHDKYFEKSISQEQLSQSVCALANRINKDYKDLNPVFVVVLNGAFMFASDLLKQFPSNCQIEFVKYASYEGECSSGTAKQLLGLKSELKDKHVVVVEDIVDTGVTIKALYALFAEKEVASLKTATMFLKPDKYKGSITIDYVGMEIPDQFVVGYGLDYNEGGRNLPDLYTLKES